MGPLDGIERISLCIDLGHVFSHVNRILHRRDWLGNLCYIRWKRRNYLDAKLSLAFELTRVDAGRQRLAGIGAKLTGLSQRNSSVHTQRQRLLLTEPSVAHTPILVCLFDQQEYALAVGILVSSCCPLCLTCRMKVSVSAIVDSGVGTFLLLR